MKSKLLFDVPQYKKLRVIIDTDAACEADDPFAIAQTLIRDIYWKIFLLNFS